MKKFTTIIRTPRAIRACRGLLPLFLAMLCPMMSYADNEKGIKVQVSEGSDVKETAMFRLSKSPRFCFDNGKVIMRLGDGDANVAELPLKNGAKMHVSMEDYTEEQNKLTVTVPAMGYSTLYSAFQLTVPAGVDVFTPMYRQQLDVLAFDSKWGEGTVLPAGTGVILKNEGTYEFRYSDAQPQADVISPFIGSAVSAPVSDFGGTIYSLGMEDGLVGFYKYTAETTVGGTAFLLLPADSQVEFVDFMFSNNIVGINDVQSTEPASTPEYNLSGQKIGSSYRGIIIRNGKKTWR